MIYEVRFILRIYKITKKPAIGLIVNITKGKIVRLVKRKDELAGSDKYKTVSILHFL